MAKKDDKIIEEALDRFKVAQEAWQDVFDAAIEDVRFVDEDDAQWDDSVKQTRKNRPCMQFDKVSGAVDQVVGDHLQNKPGIKVRGAEEGDDETAEIYEGLVRQVEQRGLSAYKTGFKFSSKGGYGAWGITHDYISPDSFDQDILLREFKNPFAVLVDPIIQYKSRKEARYGFVFDDVPVDEFKRTYPDAEVTSKDFKNAGMMHEWLNADTIRVAEYYRLVDESMTLCLLSTGEVVDKDEFLPIIEEMLEQGVTIKKEREVKRPRLECYKLTGAEILEKVDCVGSSIPLVAVFGKQSNIDGKFVCRGVIRKAKDAQRLYNYERNTYVETIALQPQQPYLATAEMILGHEASWRDLRTSNEPVLWFNFDQGQKPERASPQMPSQGLIAGLQMSADDIKAATGHFDASLGARSNETSGKAIDARTRQGSTATYEFTDELVDAIRYTGEIIIEWIPKVYDATRQIRILGEDDEERVMQINKPVMDEATGMEHVINDLSRGRYDLKVTAGPSYSTRRSETAEQLAQITAQNPEIGQLVADLYIKSLDIVGASEAVDRIRMLMIKKGIVEPTDQEKQEMAEKQPKPDPMQGMVKQLALQEKQLELKEKEAKIGETQSKTELNRTKSAELRFDMQTGALVNAYR